MPKALLVCPPEAGVVNHTIALGKVLESVGFEWTVLTSPQIAAHLHRVEPTADAVLSDRHILDFDRSNPTRRPHLEQICGADSLVRCAAFEADLITSRGIDLVVTRSYHSPVLAAQRTGVPYVNYCTDGATYLLRSLSPQRQLASAALDGELAAAASRFGVPGPKHPVPHALESPYLNVIRGLPETTYWGGHDLSSLPARCLFMGLATFDGVGQSYVSVAGLPPDCGHPLIYLTFGTVSRDSERLSRTVAALRGLPCHILVTSLHSAEEIPQDEGVYVATYIPNDVVLGRASVVVHHGGHGTFLSCLRHGVPMVVVPDNPATAQAQHGAVAEQLGVGRVIAPDDFDGLASAAKAMLQPDVTSRAQALARELSAASVAAGRTTAQTLKALAERRMEAHDGLPPAQ